MHDVRDLRETVREEIVERRESGHDVDGVAPPAEAIAAASDDELERYLDALASAPRAAGWPYDEPSGLPAIEAAQPPAPPRAHRPAGARPRARPRRVTAGRQGTFREGA